MPWQLVVLMCVYGGLMMLFAFVEPPEGLERFFRVPSVFVFLPSSWTVPVGRFVMGTLSIEIATLFFADSSGHHLLELGR
jgi:hypothetical protein